MTDRVSHRTRGTAKETTALDTTGSFEVILANLEYAGEFVFTSFGSGAEQKQWCPGKAGKCLRDQEGC